LERDGKVVAKVDSVWIHREEPTLATPGSWHGSFIADTDVPASSDPNEDLALVLADGNRGAILLEHRVHAGEVAAFLGSGPPPPSTE
jgi:hypothetical protein